ncbi:hypothetical protein BT96DRAFT_196115 [Gymnopus androsaceus JB14]|uniref:Uncharacterized protein n=1 Tax=Gymnopus androsaceus JB14 TaxID=1447944 RepID=A0A6A4GB35_9AGAR|nr:hypothetical protein BT96DRAFT_196115 [Gymnopus androsaceus JB14]
MLSGDLIRILRSRNFCSIVLRNAESGPKDLVEAIPRSISNYLHRISVLQELPEKSRIGSALDFVLDTLSPDECPSQLSAARRRKTSIVSLSGKSFVILNAKWRKLPSARLRWQLISCDYRLLDTAQSMAQIDLGATACRAYDTFKGRLLSYHRVAAGSHAEPVLERIGWC